jgi:hypothetical protein
MFPWDATEAELKVKRRTGGPFSSAAASLKYTPERGSRRVNQYPTCLLSFQRCTKVTKLFVPLNCSPI